MGEKIIDITQENSPFSCAGLLDILCPLPPRKPRPIPLWRCNRKGGNFRQAALAQFEGLEDELRDHDAPRELPWARAPTSDYQPQTVNL